MILLVLLASLWGAMFVVWYRERASDRVDSVAKFSRHLSVLERATPSQVSPLRTVEPSQRGVHRISSTPQLSRAAVAVPEPESAVPTATITLAEAYRRRRTVLIALAAAAAATFVGAVIAGGAMVLANVVVDLALAAYLVLLVRAQRIGAERRAKVAYLPPATARAGDASVDAPVVARSVHSG